MNIVPTHPEPKRGLLALLLAIPFLRTVLTAFRRTRPATRTPAAPQPRTLATPGEPGVPAVIAALCDEIRKLIPMLEAARAAEAARAQQKRARRARSQAPAPTRHGAASPTIPTAHPPTHHPSRLTPNPPTPQARDRGSG